VDLDAIYRAERGRVLASLIRLLGGFELAEEALHDAFAAAAVQWPVEGMPKNPRAWLVSAGRFKAIDRVRRRVRFDKAAAEIAYQYENEMAEPEAEMQTIADDTLRLVFTCCHPALPRDAQVAMTLREICGLTTEEIARAFLAAPSAIAQRIVRAKQKIRDEAIPYEVPDRDALPERLAPVLQAIYLVFNEGYSAGAGDAVVRAELTAEAIRLARLIYGLLPEPEVQGLLALMLLHESRRRARMTDDGDLVLLADQDRGLWDRALIDEGAALVDAAFGHGRPGPYVLQAAIAALHATARTAADTDWTEIAGLYDLLLQQVPTPVVALNRAVAIAERDGAEAGLALVDAILADGRLEDYQLAHSARADLLRRLGRRADARKAYERALALSNQEPERRFLSARIASLGENPPH
jgi:RNA polymerase sigma-70 factor, ECF subfamily